MLLLWALLALFDLGSRLCGLAVLLVLLGVFDYILNNSLGGLLLWLLCGRLYLQQVEADHRLRLPAVRCVAMREVLLGIPGDGRRVELVLE